MTKGWKYESGRHSLAARGISTSQVIKKLTHDSFRYGTRLTGAMEHLRLKDEEISLDEYFAFRNFIDDMIEQGKITDKDLAAIDREYGDIIGVPMNTSWGIQITESGRLEGTTFIISDGVNEIAEGKLVFLNPFTEEAIDWEDEGIYEARDDVLASIEGADLELSFYRDIGEGGPSRYTFLKKAMPFILKATREEGVNLEFSETFSNKEIQILKDLGFKTKYTSKTPIGRMTRMTYERE